MASVDCAPALFPDNTPPFEDVSTIDKTQPLAPCDGAFETSGTTAHTCTFIVNLVPEGDDVTTTKDVLCEFVVENPMQHPGKTHEGECVGTVSPEDASPLVVDIPTETASSGVGTDDSDSSVHVRTPVEIPSPPGLRTLSPAPSRQSTSVPDGSQDGASTGGVDDEAGHPPSVPIAIPPTPAALDNIFHIAPDVFYEKDLAPYSLEGVSPLDTFIPPSLFPTELLVHDRRGPTRRRRGQTTPLPLCYVRVYPAHDYAAHVSARLFLADGGRLGTGNHSTVYRAPLALRLDPGSQERSRASVAAKLATSECGAHAMLHQEARAYASFPREFMQDTVAADVDCDRAGGAVAQGSGADGVAESDRREEAEVGTAPEPVGECAASEGASSQKADGTDSSARNDASIAQSESTAGKTRAPPARLVTIPAVVPKFYGYYLPAKADGTPRYYSHAEDGCGLDSGCTVAWPTSILLVEECGSEVDPYAHSRAERMACLELIERLHAAGYTHNSTYVRNMLVQPGPLSAPRGERSMDCPSFRIIDFGRCKTPARGRDECVSEMEKVHDRRRAERELGL